MIGRMVTDELVQPTGTREWRCDRELGCIAGTRPMGLGRFFARFDEDCDGTIGVSETKLPGHTAHVTLPVSHMGMLMSSRRRAAGGRVPRDRPLRRLCAMTTRSPEARSMAMTAAAVDSVTKATPRAVSTQTPEPKSTSGPEPIIPKNPGTWPEIMSRPISAPPGATVVTNRCGG